MLIEENTKYMTVLGVMSTESPKFSKKTIKTVYDIRKWMYDECLRINKLLYDKENKFKYNLNNKYAYNLTLLKAYPPKPKDFTESDINTLSLMLFGQ